MKERRVHQAHQSCLQKKCTNSGDCELKSNLKAFIPQTSVRYNSWSGSVFAILYFGARGVKDGTKDDRILGRGEGRDKNEDFDN